MKYLLILSLLFIVNNKVFNEEIKETNKVDIKTLPLTIENLKYVINYYDLKYDSIIISQAILETGWFKSYNCKERHNLFGLYNTRKKEYFKFEHWTESVIGYRDLVQFKFKDGSYYKFLKELPYATDPNYINKIKSIKYDNIQ